MKKTATITITAALLFGACSEGPTPVPLPTTPQEEYGDAYQCAMAKWDSHVAEWNELTLERDATGADDVEGFEDYAEWSAHKGYPATWEEAEALYVEEGCS